MNYTRREAEELKRKGRAVLKKAFGAKGFQASAATRTKAFEEAREISADARRINEVLNLQQKKLGQILDRAFDEIGVLAKAGKTEQIARLAGVFRDVAGQMFDEIEGVQWTVFRNRAQQYCYKYGCSGADSFVSLIDAAVQMGEK
jgi:hypothetical protein